MGTRMLNIKQIITERLIKFKLFKAPVISDLFLSSCQHTPEQSIKFYKDPVISGANIQLSRLKAGMHLGVIIVWLMMCIIFIASVHSFKRVKPANLSRVRMPPKNLIYFLNILEIHRISTKFMVSPKNILKF